MKTNFFLKRISYYLRNLIPILLLFLSACGNRNEGEKNINTDTVAINTPAQEPDFISEEGGGAYSPGKQIEVQSANMFLSRMLKEVANYSNLSDSSGAIKVKVLKSDYHLSGLAENFTPEYETINTGTFAEGFGALRYNFMESSHNGSVVADFNAFKNSFQEVSGIEPVIRAEEETPFAFYNPDAIEWCMNNFYRSPDNHSFTDVSYSTLYDIIFKKFVRTLVAAHYHVIKNEMQNEVTWYKNAIIIEQKYAPAALSERYKIPEKISKADINPYYYPYAAGFWIRRSIDGTEAVLWKNLVRMVTDYDYDWACVNFKLCERG